MTHRTSIFTAKYLCFLQFLLATAATLAFAGPASGAATRRLIMVGGGEKPREAMQRFVEWANGRSGKLLIIPWASGYTAEELMRDYRPLFGDLGLTQMEMAPAITEFPAALPGFLHALSQATAVFFAGGDQNRISDLLDQSPSIRSELQAAYRNGIVFAGTSAGTAIMSKTMLTGDGDLTKIQAGLIPVRQGLGLLDQVVVDQHFIKRQRMNRLLSVLISSPEKVGVGIDEDSSLAVEDDCKATMIGPTQVLFLRKQEAAGAFDLRILSAGQTVNWCE